MLEFRNIVKAVLKEYNITLEEDRYDPEEFYVKTASINQAKKHIPLPKSIIRKAYNMKYNNFNKFYPSDKVENILYNGNQSQKITLAKDFISNLNDFEREKLPYEKDKSLLYVIHLFNSI